MLQLVRSALLTTSHKLYHNSALERTGTVRVLRLAIYWYLPYQLRTIATLRHQTSKCPAKSVPKLQEIFRPLYTYQPLLLVQLKHHCRSLRIL